MTKYIVKYTSQFKKDAKRAEKQGKDITLMKAAIDLLASDGPLPDKFHDHALTGNWDGFRECHIAPDWLLIYMKEKDILVLTLSRTGSHSELFNK